jgi:excisionase family DNA binding protein
MATATQTHEFYTTSELAELLRVTETTIYRMARRGELPYYTIGRSMRFRNGDVDEFLKRCRGMRHEYDAN